MTQLRPSQRRKKYLPASCAPEKPAIEPRFDGDKKLIKRAEDLAWQMNFAKMKLNHWHDLDNF